LSQNDGNSLETVPVSLLPKSHAAPVKFRKRLRHAERSGLQLDCRLVTSSSGSKRNACR
jgi:hypothetical protein